MAQTCLETAPCDRACKLQDLIPTLVQLSLGSSCIILLGCHILGNDSETSFSVTRKSLRGKGKQEAGLYEWASEVDEQFRENSEIVLHFTQTQKACGLKHFHNKMRHSLTFSTLTLCHVFQRLCHP